MEFWDTFVEESLYKPWMIGPEKGLVTSGSEPEQKKVFILPVALPEELYQMVAKMILALKYKPTEVALVEMNESDFGQVESWSSAKKIMCFGESYLSSFGEFVNLHGHQMIATYDLNQLSQNPDLKKQTWHHLKKYASLK